MDLIISPFLKRTMFRLAETWHNAEELRNCITKEKEADFLEEKRQERQFWDTSANIYRLKINEK